MTQRDSQTHYIDIQANTYTETDRQIDRHSDIEADTHAHREREIDRQT